MSPALYSDDLPPGTNGVRSNVIRMEVNFLSPRTRDVEKRINAPLPKPAASAQAKNLLFRSGNDLFTRANLN
jgi:hypothetical protein